MRGIVAWFRAIHPSTRFMLGVFGAFALLILVGSLNRYFGDTQSRDQGSASQMRETAAESSVDAAEAIEEIGVVLIPCDVAWAEMVAMADSAPDRFQAYEIAQTAIRTCSFGWDKLREIERRDGMDELAELVELCQIKANERQSAAELVAEMIDGDRRPSAVERARTAVAAAEGASVACEAALN